MEALKHDALGLLRFFGVLVRRRGITAMNSVVSSSFSNTKRVGLVLSGKPFKIINYALCSNGNVLICRCLRQ
jgi:hypothetical protein